MQPQKRDAIFFSLAGNGLFKIQQSPNIYEAHFFYPTFWLGLLVQMFCVRIGTSMGGSYGPPLPF